MSERKKFVMIGAGIMSATLANMVAKLMPMVELHIYERLDQVAAESSDAWNNAGTGHSAFCELNYTPLDRNGKVDISKALQIAQQFEESKQFWAYLKEQGCLPSNYRFINDIPHMSFVWGAENVEFLKKRHASMTQYPIFQDMEYSDDLGEISKWVPLMMKGRTGPHSIAATRMDAGTDVNFGALTKEMISYLQSLDQIHLHLGHEVEDLTKLKDGKWKIDVKKIEDASDKDIICDYIFIGAGGGALPLLEKSDIPDVLGYGGFPISGQFLSCNNPAIVAQHQAKVYGKAAVGAPPMSVPHLDTRWMEEGQTLLFGPYAGFSTKFLKNGSYLDLFLSIEMHNVWPMLSAGAQNIELTKYLINQVSQSPEDRFIILQEYYPEAHMDDWKLTIAGQRVQIIKKDKKEGGVLLFGTEIVCSADGTISALLGASPGASTSVPIMIDVLANMFPELINSSEWKDKIVEMIPSYGKSLIDHGELCLATRKRTNEILQLEY